MRVDKTFTLNRFRIGLYLEVLNVYNRANAENLVYGGRQLYQEGRITSLPVFPNLGCGLIFDTIPIQAADAQPTPKDDAADFVEIGGIPVPGLCLTEILKANLGIFNRSPGRPMVGILRRLPFQIYQALGRGTVRIWDIDGKYFDIMRSPARRLFTARPSRPTASGW